MVISIFQRALFVAIIAAGLTGCKIYQSIGKSVGGFLHPVSGPQFVHIDNSKWDQQNSALIYFYRPHSDWASEEIESPSVYIDDQHYFNFRNNSYTWLEVAPGKRHIRMRRPLLGLEGIGSFALSKMVDAELEVEAGKVYYLRYSEVTTPEQANAELEKDSPWAQGDMQLVAPDYAYTEIVKTRFLNSDLLAPNHAGTSIVKKNMYTDFDQRELEIKKEREAELARLEASGEYSSSAWWCLWLCGGDAEPSLAADRKMADLERDRAAYEQKLAQQEPKSSWWPF